MKASIRTALVIAAALLAAGCGRGAADCDSLLLTGAWVREAPPGVDAAAGYLTVFNSGSGPVVVTGAASPDFERATMHRTERVGGQARMRPLARVTVAAGDRHVFRPGGDHLMLMGPRAALVAGDEVRLRLQCRTGGPRTAVAPIRRKAPPDA